VESRERALASELLFVAPMRTIPVVLLLSSSVAFAADSSSSDPFDDNAPVIDDTIDEPVVGGTPAKPGAYPDAVAVIAPNALCSGTLIAPDLVLTAGHCIEMKPTKVVIGSVDLAKSPQGETIAVKSAIAYPDWQHRYDVGLLELDKPSHVKPRPIAQACTATEDLATNKKVRVVGFGLTSANGKGSNSLLEDAELPIDDPTCAKDPACRPKPINPGGEFIAGGHGVDSCFGDSGAPLLAPTKHGEALIGVVSRGIGSMGMPCGQGGVGVRVDKVALWIEKTSKRKLVHAKCDGSGAGSNQDDGSDDAQAAGCSATTGALGSGLLVIAAAMMLARPRRREARARS
jgi:secreted trypsin-like serine protease